MMALIQLREFPAPSWKRGCAQACKSPSLRQSHRLSPGEERCVNSPTPQCHHASVMSSQRSLRVKTFGHALLYWQWMWGSLAKMLRIECLLRINKSYLLGGFMRLCITPHPSLCLSLSLTHTQTHKQTHTHTWRERERKTERIKESSLMPFLYYQTNNTDQSTTSSDRQKQCLTENS